MVTSLLLLLAPLVLASNEEAPLNKVDYTPPIVQPIAGFDVYTEITRLSNHYAIDEDLVKRIIGCESGFVKDALNINKRDGVAWSEDIGWWQINDYYHKGMMDSMGLDIYDPQDNLEYGFMLLNSKGTKPWQASKFCWNTIDK